MNFLAGTAEDVEEDSEAPSLSMPTKSANKALPSWLAHDQQPYETSTSAPSCLQPLAVVSSPAPAALTSSPQSLHDAIRTLFDSGISSPSADILHLVVTRLDDFPLLKLGRNGVAEMRSFFFSADGLEMLWKGKRGSYDVVPIQKLVGISLDFPVESDANDAVAKLRHSHLSFVLQFTHRNIILAARSELERRIFLCGVLRLRDRAAGCTVGQCIWQDIAHLLFETPHSPLQQQPLTTSVRNKRVSVTSGHGMLLLAAQSTQQHRLSVPKPSLPKPSAASSSDASPSPAVVKQTAVQKRIIRVASDDVVIDCCAQLMSDGTVVVRRVAAANKVEDSVELVVSTVFDASSNDGKSHVWTSEVT